jgi:hypothetical protein
MQPWKTLTKRVVCHPNRFLTVEIHELELPDGRRIPDWPWLITPDYANVLARTTDGRFLCFRQFKYAVNGRLPRAGRRISRAGRGSAARRAAGAA